MPIVDAADLPDEPLRADVVVVGSGPAGMTVALDLADAGADVLLLESGGRQPGGAARDLDDGELVGEPFRFDDRPAGLADVRMRALGGTSWLWSGMCRPLGPDELAHPGAGQPAWPLTLADLEAWYRSAEATLGLEAGAWDPQAWHDRLGSEPLLADTRLREVVFQVSAPVRFAEAFGARLEAAAGPRVVLGATVVDLALAAGGRRIGTVTAHRAGPPLTAVADRAVVVATGAIEVPRLLLASGAGAGIANSSGLVGVGFMEHPHRWAGRVRLTVDAADLGPARLTPSGRAVPSAVWSGWEVAGEVLAAEGVPNAVALLWFGQPRGPVVDPSPPLAGAVGSLAGAVEGRGAPLDATVTIRTGQRPLATSRVALGPGRDATGLPRLRLDWQVDPADRAGGRRLAELLAEALGAAGAGRLEVDPDGRPLDEWPLEIGHHPMGTARMHVDPTAGVVDADCRSHDVEGLYVAGSATFPASGHANPTLTIVALAHRLADHLGGG